MSFETVGKEFRKLLVETINGTWEGILQAHLKLSDPTKTNALQITDAIVRIQELRGFIYRGREPFQILQAQYLQGYRHNFLEVDLAVAGDMNQLLKKHTDMFRAFKKNEQYFLEELDRRANLNIEGASQLKALSVFAKDPENFLPAEVHSQRFQHK